MDQPKKKKSGAQFRKERAAREQAAKKAPAPSLVSVNTWTQAVSEYSQASMYYDPKAPPQELPLYGQPPPTLVAQIQGALTQLEQGVFWSAAYLWDSMSRDDRVAATLGQRIDRLVGSPIELEPADRDNETDGEQEDQAPQEARDGAGRQEPDGSTKGDPDEEEDSEEQQACDQIQRHILEMIPPHQQYELMRYAFGLSVGIAQVLTTRSPKGNQSTIQVWNNRFLRYDWMIRKFCLVTENKGEIVLDEEDPEWIIYQPFGPRGWLHGAMIRSIAQPWLIRQWVRNWWARHQEVHGQPIRLGELPPSRTPADEARFLSELKKIGFESVIRLPTGTDGNKFDVRLLEAAVNGWEGFQKLLDHCDDSIAIAILGQRQSTMGQGGLKAQDDAGESTLLRLTRKDALIGDLFREKLLKPWANDNLGDEECAPHIRWQFEAAEDEKESANTDFLVGQALNQFKTAAAPIDVRAYLEERGYPLISEEDEQAQKMEQQAQDQKDAEVAHSRALELAQSRGGPPSALASTKTAGA